MPNLYIEKIRDTERAEVSVFAALEKMMNETRRRAFEFYERRGGAPGSDLDDWLRAERELLWASTAELVEDEKQFRVHLAVPGVEPNHLRITALPQTIVVRAESSHQHERQEGRVHFCEFNGRRLLRSFNLQTPIDVDRVSATLDKGVLEITATKVEKPEHGRPVKVTAAA